MQTAVQVRTRAEKKSHVQHDRHTDLGLQDIKGNVGRDGRFDKEKYYSDENIYCGFHYFLTSRTSSSCLKLLYGITSISVNIPALALFAVMTMPTGIPLG